MTRMEQCKKKIVLPRWLEITLKIVEWSIILFIVGCFLTLVAQRMVGETPSLFGYTTYSVLTDSMEPTYNVGDVVVCKRIKNVTKDDVAVGDVISFIAPKGFNKNEALVGHTITHRIWEGPYQDEDGQWYVRTIGDNVAAIQDTVPIPLENIQGVVVGSSPIISKLANFLSNWYGFAILIVIPLVCVLAWQIIVLARQGAKERMEEIKKNQVLMIERQVQQDLEEEIKRKAVEEYIKQQETKENNGSNT